MEWFKGSVGEAIGVAKQAGGLIAFQVVDTGKAAEDTMKAWSAAQVFTPLSYSDATSESHSRMLMKAQPKRIAQ